MGDILVNPINIFSLNEIKQQTIYLNRKMN